eukprot:1391457-Amphidinium_carterae.1
MAESCPDHCRKLARAPRGSSMLGPLPRGIQPKGDLRDQSEDQKCDQVCDQSSQLSTAQAQRTSEWGLNKVHHVRPPLLASPGT